MSQPSGAGVVVWERQVDHLAAQQRWRRLGFWLGGPAVLVVVTALLSSGVGAAAGLLVCFVFVGAVIAFWIMTVNRGYDINNEIRLVDGHLADTTTRVVVAHIEAWTTIRTSPYIVANGLGSSAPVAVVRFRVATPGIDARSGSEGPGDDRPAHDSGLTIVTFPWPEMTAGELEGVRQALEPHIPAPWVPGDRLHG